MKEIIQGFSKLSRAEKVNLAAGWVTDRSSFLKDVRDLVHPDNEREKRLEEISENTISLYPMPYSLAPNFLINGTLFHLPMVTEESSVVAAASSGAKFWSARGGFKARVLGMQKTGQLHFSWKGNAASLFQVMPELESYLRDNLHHLTARMEKRGGGITGMELLDMTGELEDYFQLRIFFQTGDSMGANFINSCMEEAGRLTQGFLEQRYPGRGCDYEVIMAILSNYTPESLVEVYVECEPEKLAGEGGITDGNAFATKFRKAVDIALIDPYRAVTHNKGIFNGIDAFMLATANDFRAVEANGHAWAARDGKYRGLSYVHHDSSHFIFGLILPLSIGSVGGLTRLHPMARWSFDILGNPGAANLMMMAAAAGLANHFSAIKALVTNGIQSGHMKMHLDNILAMLEADEHEKKMVLEHFREKTVSYSDVKNYIEKNRSRT
ncbi:MAG TPA: hypothetical protein VE870_08180 [Bacteroidales bacterium]|nr:hypothetical protein [Bacteroidales bacterium]